jgi:hypothetical protein
MESTLRNIIIIGVIVVFLAGIGLFVINRTGLRDRIANRNNPSDQQPLGETPEPTVIPFPSSTPFPFLGIITSTATPSSSPSSVLGSSVSSPSAAPIAPQLTCSVLGAAPIQGRAPLSVKFTAKGEAINGANREYEFVFGDGQSVRQAGTSVTHRYQTAGSYIASLTVRDSQGNPVDVGVQSCQQTITATGTAKATASASPAAATTLPKTGPESFLLFLIAPIAGFGMWLYRKFRLL